MNEQEFRAELKNLNEKIQNTDWSQFSKEEKAQFLKLSEMADANASREEIVHVMLKICNISTNNFQITDFLSQRITQTDIRGISHVLQFRAELDDKTTQDKVMYFASALSSLMGVSDKDAQGEVKAHFAAMVKEDPSRGQSKRDQQYQVLDNGLSKVAAAIFEVWDHLGKLERQ